MKSVRTLRKAFDRISASGAEAARPKVRHAPACEMLEGRQLLNAAWTPPHGFAGWDGAAGKGADPAAHVYMLEARGAHRAGHTFAFSGAPGGVAPSGVAGKTFKVTPQLQTDFQTLQTDQKTLMAQISPSLTAAAKADRAVIQQALSKLPPSQMEAMHSGGPQGGTTSSNPTANMTATLTTAGISPSQITAMETDFKNLQTAMSTTDPTLQAKIAADEAAIAKDGGPAMPANGHSTGLRMF